MTPEQEAAWADWDRMLDLLVTIAGIPELEPPRETVRPPITRQHLRKKLARRRRREQERVRVPAA